MDAFKIAIKLFAASDEFDPSAFVAIFQRWIQTQALAGHMLIDVADYAHVPDGPGTVLVSSEANLSTDRGGKRLGLFYFRKMPMEGAFFDRLRQVMTSALKAAALLEADPALAGRLKFVTDEFIVRINDRLLAPNTDATFAAVKPQLQRLGKLLYGAEHVTLGHTPSPLTLFDVHVRAVEGPTIQTLIGRLA
jgi:hypothetical protein